MKQLNLFTLMALLVVPSAFAGIEQIVCRTPNMEKAFVVHEEGIAFLQNTKYSGRPHRSIAAVPSVRTKQVNEGFDKFFRFEGNKYKVHIENKKHFSDIDDYISIRSYEGHEMTYPLSCMYRD